MEEDFISLSEACRLLRRTRQAIRLYVRQGRLTPYHPATGDRRTFFRRREVEALARLEPEHFQNQQEGAS